MGDTPLYQTVKHNKNTLVNTQVLDNNKKNNKSLSEFEKFWEIYDYKTGKEKTLKAWSKIPLELHTKIFEIVPEYVTVTNKDGKFPSRKHPSTWLNQNGWDDEIPATEESTQEHWETELKEKYAI